jgi:hypothetical protein
VRVSDPVTAEACLMQDGPHQLAQPFIRGYHPDALPSMASRKSRLHLACPSQPAADLG